MPNEMKPRTVHTSSAICLTAEGNSRKPRLGDRLKAVRPVIASNGVDSLLPNEVLMSIEPLAAAKKLYSVAVPPAPVRVP